MKEPENHITQDGLITLSNGGEVYWREIDRSIIEISTEEEPEWKFVCEIDRDADE